MSGNQSCYDKSSVNKVEIASIVEKSILSAKPPSITHPGVYRDVTNGCQRYQSSPLRKFHIHKGSRGLGVEVIRISMYLYGCVIAQQVKMMGPDIHPEHYTVILHDTSVDEYFKVGSAIKTDREIKLDGVTYSYVTVDISSKLHPFYIGRLRTMASERNVVRFTQRFGCFISTKKGA